LAESALEASVGLQEMGFPAVNYLAVLSYRDQETPDWGIGGSVLGQVPMTMLPSGNGTNASSLAIALVDQFDTKRFFDMLGDGDNVLFSAQHGKFGNSI
jgi:hypothetical protein